MEPKKVLSLFEFNLLTADEKAEAVWSGTFLGDRMEKAFRVQLYRVAAFYVEVFYDGDVNKIVEFRPFNSYDLLTPYLKQ
jgi:hypothetical protein